jgi:arabinogalactan endo-1,4-beta-galactosidase
MVVLGIRFSTMKWINFCLIGLLFFLFACKKDSKKQIILPEPNPFVKGFDLSMLPQLRASGISVYNENGVKEDMLLTLKNAGVNTIRLRLWKDPAGGFSGLEEVKQLSNEIKQIGLKVWLTVHYSDTWADPGAQAKPAVWKDLPYVILKDSVFNYTQLIVQEIHPDYIQIGNEVNNGFLWPEGNASNRTQFLELMNIGIDAVNKVDSSTKIILQYAGYKDVINYLNFIGSVNVDIIGLSYYPMWHGKNLDSLQLQLSNVAKLTGKPVIIAETSYPFTLAWNDWTNNILGDSNQLIPNYPATTLGQKEFLNKIRQVTSNATNGHGFCYWGGEWISFKGSTSKEGSPYENQALWNFNAKALPALEVFK